jgi:hypothetical protein
VKAPIAQLVRARCLYSNVYLSGVIPVKATPRSWVRDPLGAILPFRCVVPHVKDNPNL